jgi:hypothetical protein
MIVKVFTDKNLHRHISTGWSLQALAEGKGLRSALTRSQLVSLFLTASTAVATLTGRIIELNVPTQGTVLCIKKQLEDLEGWRIEDQSLRTPQNQPLNDSDKLASVGIAPESKSRLKSTT